MTVEGKKYLLFKNKKYKPLQHLPDYDVVSSLVGMQKEVRTWRYIGIGIVNRVCEPGFEHNRNLEVRMEGTVIGTVRDVSKLQAEIAANERKGRFGAEYDSKSAREHSQAGERDEPAFVCLKPLAPQSNINGDRIGGQH